MTIAILGGTGPQGSGLALRFAIAGVDVVIGSRDGTRAADGAAALAVKLPAGAGSISGLGNDEAVAAADEIVILSVPWNAHQRTLEGIKAPSPEKSWSISSCRWPRTTRRKL